MTFAGGRRNVVPIVVPHRSPPHRPLSLLPSPPAPLPFTLPHFVLQLVCLSDTDQCSNQHSYSHYRASLCRRHQTDCHSKWQWGNKQVKQTNKNKQTSKEARKQISKQKRTNKNHPRTRLHRVFVSSRNEKKVTSILQILTAASSGRSVQPNDIPSSRQALSGTRSLFSPYS